MEIFSGILIAFVAILLFSAVRVLREYERGVVFFLGRFYAVKGPGLIILIPVVQQMVKLDLRTVVLDVPSQDLITRDNVSVKVNAVLYFRVVDPERAIINVEDYMEATGQLAQTTLGPCSVSTNSTRCSPNATSSTSICRRSSISRPTNGASRSRTWRSSTSTSTKA